MAAVEVGCPYVGLVPFTEDEARFFFGREREKRLIVANLFASRLTLLYGASGVGKSSVLRAGVIHDIERRAARSVEEGDAPAQVVTYVKDWQGDVLGRLREAVRRAVVRAFPTADLAALADGARLAEGFGEATEKAQVDILVICDQFEEYFLYHEDDDEPDGFARQLAEAVNRPGLAVSFLFALRDDALSRLDRFKVLIPSLFANYLRLDPLGAEAAEAAVVQPVRVHNQLLPRDAEPVEIEPALISDVIEQVRTGRLQVGDVGQGRAAGDGAGVEAPYLQLVMTRIWQHELDAGFHKLRRQTLEDLGGAATIVQGHLDRVMDELPEEEREICARMFQYLVTPSGAKIAHSTADLVGYADVAPSRMTELLGKIAGSRMRILVPVAPGDAAGEVRYEIYHDSLGQAVLDWRRRHVEEKEREEREIEAKRQQAELEKERRAARRLRWLVAALTVVVLIAIGASVVAWIQTKSARDNADRADANAKKATENELKAVTNAREVAAVAQKLESALADKQAEEEQRKELELRNLELQGESDKAEKLRREIQTSKEESRALSRTLDDLRQKFGASTEDKTDLSQLAEGQLEQLGQLETERDQAQKERDQALTRVTELEGQLTRVRDKVRRLQVQLEEAGVLEIAELGMQFQPIRAGRFQMGSPKREKGRDFDETQHEVILTRDFWMGEIEVTQKQWSEVMGNNPARFKDCEDCPVEQVNWFEAVTFANRLSEREGKELCYELKCEGTAGSGGEFTCDVADFKGSDCDGYRLPTEAEWEYAARAGTTTAFWTGSDLTADQANFNNALRKTAPVRSYAANPWGLYEVHGNVWEWVQDWSGSYPGETVTDPTGPERASDRVIRGGSWRSDPRSARVASRSRDEPSLRSDVLGCRVARSLP